MWNSSEGLGKEPPSPAKTYWKRIWSERPDAVPLFQVLAIFRERVPFDIAEKISEVSSAARKHLFSDGYLKGLISIGDNWVTICDPILKDYILRELSKEEEKKKRYIKRAMEVCCDQLKASKNKDSFAAMNLPPLILESKGPEAFVNVLLDGGCVSVLLKNCQVTPAIDFCKQAVQMVLPDSKQEADLKHYLGQAYYISYCTSGKSEELSLAEKMYLHSLKIYNSHNWSEGISPIYSDLGDLYVEQGKLDEAEELQLRAIEIDEQLGKSAETACYYGRIAMVYRRRRDLDKAEETALKALKLAEQHGLEEEVARQYNNLGLIYLHQYKLEKAKDMFKKGLEINKRLGRSLGMAHNYANLGWVHKALQETEMAEKYWQQASDLFGKFGIDYLRDVDE